MVTNLAVLAGVLSAMTAPTVAQARVPLTGSYAGRLIASKLQTLYPSYSQNVHTHCHPLSSYTQACAYLALRDSGEVGFEVGAYGETVGCYRGSGIARKSYPHGAPLYSITVSRPVAVWVESASQLAGRCLAFTAAG
jgi:hypothetical protein